MRKKSHIAIARYLARSIDHPSLHAYRKTFCLGSILPDLKPSFIKVKHEYEGTIDMVRAFINHLVENWELYQEDQRSFMMHVGEVLHYVTDYFTYPHNSIYEGSLKDHCVYEGELKNYLVDYIRSGAASADEQRLYRFYNVDDLLDYLGRKHQEYLQGEHTMEADCRYSTQVCRQMMAGVIQICEEYAMAALRARREAEALAGAGLAVV